MTRGSLIRVSDHALVRFIERAGGMDVEQLRTTIESSLKRSIEAAESIGTGNLTVLADGLRYVIVRNVVVTVTGPARR